MSYKLAVFDMDGTILDTLQDITNAINYALRVNSYPEHTIDEVRFFVGNGLGKLVERAVPEGSSEEVCKKVFDDLIPYYIEHSADTTKPYKGICELLKKLKAAGVKCAVVSNKADAAVQQLVIDYFDGLFDAVLGESPKRMRFISEIPMWISRQPETAAWMRYWWTGDSEAGSF